MSKEENRTEKTLTTSEQELRLLVEAIPALVWRAGPEGNIEYVNKRVLDYFGAPLGEVIGWGWMDKVHPDDVAFKVRTWLQNLESGNPHDVVCRFRGADGRYRWFEVRGEPSRASDGSVQGWYGVLIDIDDRRKVTVCCASNCWAFAADARQTGAATQSAVVRSRFLMMSPLTFPSSSLRRGPP
jgi:PAS domain S-box-containing protein